MSLTAAAVRRALLLAPLAGQKGRVALSIAAIALGVALAYGVHLINSIAAGELEHALRVLSGNADFSLHGPRAGFPEGLYPQIASLPEVAAASPVIEFEARVPGKPEPLKLLGIDVFRAASIQPDLALAEGGESIDFLRPDSVFLSRAAAQWLSLRPGDEIALQTGLARSKFKVAGLLSSGSVRDRIGVLDIAAAQSAFGRLGSITRLEIRLRAGVRADAFAAQLRERLPPGLVVETPQALIERNASLSRAYRVNLNVLALVAIFTGSLLVFSSQALAVVRRRSEFALLRALGVTRRGVVGRVLLEAALLGLAGAALGLALGHVLAGWVLRHYGADLGAGFFRGLDARVSLDPAGLVLFGLLGVLAALGGSIVAAREAARAEPARALRAGDEENAFSRLNTWTPGAALIVLGALASLAPPVRGLPLGGYVSITLLLLGLLSLMPRISRGVFRLAPMRGPVAARLALAQLRGAPGQAGVSLAAIVASVALMASMAIMVLSFRQSLDAWLGRVLPAQLYLRIPTGSEATLIPAALEAKLARLPGVSRVQFTRAEQIVLSPQHAAVTLLARDINPSRTAEVLPLVGDQRLPPSGAPPPAWVSEALADLYRLHVGSTVDVPVGAAMARFTVAGIWRDYIRQQGAIVIERKRFAELSASGNASEAAFWIEPGADTGDVALRIRAMLGGLVADILEPGELREISLKIFDRTFGVTYALEAVAVLIGLFALSASFGALALARRREFGMLRHLGMTRRQIGTMLAFEGTLVSALGVGAGLALGWIIGLILIHVVNRQSFHWTMELHMPWGPLSAFTAAMLALASLTAWIGARRATGGEAVKAVSEVW